MIIIIINIKSFNINFYYRVIWDAKAFENFNVRKKNYELISSTLSVTFDKTCSGSIESGLNRQFKPGRPDSSRISTESK
jgi:hypothetical protein